MQFTLMMVTAYACAAPKYLGHCYPIPPLRRDLRNHDQYRTGKGDDAPVRQCGLSTTFSCDRYFYSTVLNFFVPSAGSKWIVEAPYLIPAAEALGISIPSVTL